MSDQPSYRELHEAYYAASRGRAEPRTLYLSPGWFQFFHVLSGRTRIDGKLLFLAAECKIDHNEPKFRFEDVQQ